MEKKYYLNIKGKEYCKYEGLLAEYHARTGLGIDVVVIQFPSEANGMTAICKATVKDKDGNVWSVIGDANQSNVNKMIAHHIIRMASTRAKARSFRDMLNIGVPAIEELGESSDSDGNGNGHQSDERDSMVSEVLKLRSNLCEADRLKFDTRYSPEDIGKLNHSTLNKIINHCKELINKSTTQEK